MDSSMLLDWLLNMPMPRQAPRGLQGVAALQRRIALSMWHSLLGSTTLSLSPASLSSCSGAQFRLSMHPCCHPSLETEAYRTVVRGCTGAVPSACWNDLLVRLTRIKTILDATQGPQG